MIPPNEAVIVAEFGQSMRFVLTGNVALVNPGATVTLDGTVATEVLLLESAMTTPPAGAGPLNVTVLVEELPPAVLDGLTVTEVRTGGITVIEVVCVTPLRTAETTAGVAVATGVVVTAKLALVLPSGMVADAGTLTAGLLLDKETTVPPVGAGPLNATVPVGEPPPVALAALKPNEDKERAFPRLKSTFHLMVLKL